jgi:hypothetical protein
MPGFDSRSRSHIRRYVVLIQMMTAAIAASVAVVDGWWDRGHFITGQAAAEALPPEMPAFFRDAAAQITYLNYEPDRWKESAERKADQALNGASSPEHYMDMEYVPAALLALPNRFEFMLALAKQKKMSGGQTGMLPFRIVELFQTIRINFRLWRNAPNPTTRGWIEARIIDDAGVLGHYVGDASNPLHTTMHHNGWVGKKNPNKFTTDNTLHARFEGKFVEAQITVADVRPRVRAEARVIAQPRQEIVKFINESHAQVEPLYRLEQQEKFTETTTAPSHKTFVVDRLAAGATFLRDLWWTAYITSAEPAPQPTTSR